VGRLKAALEKIDEKKDFMQVREGGREGGREGREGCCFEQKEEEEEEEEEDGMMNEEEEEDEEEGEEEGLRGYVREMAPGLVGTVRLRNPTQFIKKREAAAAGVVGAMTPTKMSH
jgi:hypothetical protein